LRFDIRKLPKGLSVSKVAAVDDLFQGDEQAQTGFVDGSLLPTDRTNCGLILSVWRIDAQGKMFEQRNWE
jgi:hypothetical protein